MSDLRPEPQRVISSLPALRAASHPLRQRLLAAFNAAPRTVRDVADELGLDPHNLYYHVHLLEEHGMLRVAETRLVSGIVERSYQVTAHDFVVDTSLVSPSAPGADTVLDEVLHHTLRRTEGLAREMVRGGVVDLGRRAPEPSALLARASYVRLSRGRAAELSRRILDLVAEACAEASGRDDERGYWMSATFFPCELSDDDPSEGPTT